MATKDETAILEDRWRGLMVGYEPDESGDVYEYTESSSPLFLKLDEALGQALVGMIRTDAAQEYLAAAVEELHGVIEARAIVLAREYSRKTAAA